MSTAPVIPFSTTLTAHSRRMWLSPPSSPHCQPITLTHGHTLRPHAFILHSAACLLLSFSLHFEFHTAAANCGLLAGWPQLPMFACSDVVLSPPPPPPPSSSSSVVSSSPLPLSLCVVCCVLRVACRVTQATSPRKTKPADDCNGNSVATSSTRAGATCECAVPAGLHAKRM